MFTRREGYPSKGVKAGVHLNLSEILVSFKRG